MAKRSTNGLYQDVVTATTPLQTSGQRPTNVSLIDGTTVGNVIAWSGAEWMESSSVTGLTATSPLAIALTPDHHIYLEAGTTGDVLAFDGADWVKSSQLLTNSGAISTLQGQVALKLDAVSASLPLQSSGGLSPTISIVAGTTGDVLAFDGADWAASSQLLTNSGDISTLQGQVALKLDAVSASLPLHSSGGLSPTISIVSGTTGDVLVFDGADWAASSQLLTNSGDISTLQGQVALKLDAVSASLPLQSSGGLSPAISIVAGTTGDVLVFDGADWAASSQLLTDSGDISTLQGQVALKLDAVSASLPLQSSGGLSPAISIVAGTTGDVLKFDGADWVASSQLLTNSGDISTLQGQVAIKLDSVSASLPLQSSGGLSPAISIVAGTTGDVLVFDGADWVTSSQLLTNSGDISTLQGQVASKLDSISVDPPFILSGGATTPHLSFQYPTSSNFWSTGTIRADIADFSVTAPQRPSKISASRRRTQPIGR